MRRTLRLLLVATLAIAGCSRDPPADVDTDSGRDAIEEAPALDPGSATPDSSVSSEPEPAEGTFTAVTAGYWHTCAIRAKGGTVECWGVNDSAVLDAPDGQFKALAAGNRHNCAIRIDGRIECWGHDAGNLHDVPDGSFTAVSAGGDHSCALRDDGDVECWGDGDTYPRSASGGPGHTGACPGGGSSTRVGSRSWLCS